MGERRVDRIANVLEERNGRARIRDILTELRQRESNEAIAAAAIHVAIQAENTRLEKLGERPRFRTVRQGEEWGWVRLEPASEFDPGSLANRIERTILDANKKVDEEIRSHLQKMDWRTFESTFLAEVLEKLGFQDVQITQPTRDGGTDARVTYKRGIVEAKAIVSAKKWSSRSVGVEEVRLMRGVQGNEDTAIIVTTGRFTADAQQEARPSQNQRIVYLIDGEQVVEICKRHYIGVKTAALPELLVLDEERFLSSEEEDEADEQLDEEPAAEDEGIAPGGARHPRRLRESMLGDADAGLSVEEIADLVGLQPNSVRSDLCDETRRRDLAERIRHDADARRRALRLIAEKRARADTVGQTPGREVGGKRLRETMLGDRDQGLGPDEIADLLGLHENTVRVYLCDEDRRRGMFERIRSDPDIRNKALRVVAKKRGPE
jgi:restriction endonuclease Mrr